MSERNIKDYVQPYGDKEDFSRLSQHELTARLSEAMRSLAAIGCNNQDRELVHAVTSRIENIMATIRE